MAMKAKHAFGNLKDVQNALDSGKINAYDILFLDGDTKPKVGWIDANGAFRLVESEADLTEIETELAELESQIATKASSEEIDEKLEAALGEYLAKKYKVSHKPNGTLVNYRDKEIRIFCPADTEWQLQNSGEGADANCYYIGFKAYAPESAVSFKEDLAKTIADETMYYFEGNDFAGIDADSGRKYSIVWLPVAKYDADNDAWTYYGVNSSEDKYIGWYYSVEWYDANGKIITSDCIRINLTNENCHSSVQPYYVGEVKTEIKTMVESKIEEKIAEVDSAYEIIEF